MIVLFTDFGWNGPYVGQMKAVLYQHVSAIPIIDLLHDAPRFNSKASAYLLASFVQHFPAGTIFICIVDPGVGDPDRVPCLLQADGQYFVGPDNGLFDTVIYQANHFLKHEIIWRPKNMSSTFHGRDLFAPVAASIANNQWLDVKTLIHTAAPCGDLYEVIYIDHYGNCMIGVHAQSVAKEKILTAKGKKIYHADTFSAVKEGECFWYENSNGLVEIAVNQGSAAELLLLSIGNNIEFYF